jgi:hypothetical protein
MGYRRIGQKTGTDGIFVLTNMGLEEADEEKIGESSDTEGQTGTSSFVGKLEMVVRRCLKRQKAGRKGEIHNLSLFSHAPLGCQISGSTGGAGSGRTKMLIPDGG